MPDTKRDAKVIDGTHAVLGRLSTAVAQKLLADEQIIIINSEKIIVTGDPLSVTRKYIKLKQIGSPQHGPFLPTRPDMLVKRTVRGMLPKSPRGRAALKKLRVEIGNPNHQEGERIAIKPIRSNYITMGKIARNLGWKA